MFGYLKCLLLKETPDYNYRIVRVDRVVDGDTADLTLAVLDKHLDLGFHLSLHIVLTAAYRFRFLGVDAFEKNKAGGSDATKYTTAWLNYPPGELWGRTQKTDSFGRWLIDIRALTNDEAGKGYRSLSEDLIADGHAVPYKE